MENLLTCLIDIVSVLIYTSCTWLSHLALTMSWNVLWFFGKLYDCSMHLSDLSPPTSPLSRLCQHCIHFVLLICLLHPLNVFNLSTLSSLEIFLIAHPVTSRLVPIPPIKSSIFFLSNAISLGFDRNVSSSFTIHVLRLPRIVVVKVN